MQLTPFAPRSDTKDLIEGLAVLRTATRVTRTLVAEGRLTVGVRIAGAAQVWRHDGWRPLPPCTLTGVHCTSRTVHTDAGSTLVLVHLHPAAGPVLGVEPAHLAERTVDLATLWPAAALTALVARIAQAPDDSARARCLEAQVAAQLRHHDAGADGAVIEAVGHIRRAAGDVRIGELARRLAISTDTLERRFAACVGITPKRFARAVRLRQAVLGYSGGVNLAELAAATGYSDQSHLVREMRHATGQAPTRLLGSGAYC